MQKNNNEKNLIRYSISLLVVAMACIAIGGISLSRSINRGDGRVMQNFNVKEKVAHISQDILRLTRENSQLKIDVENIKAAEEKAVKEKTALENKVKAYELYLSALELDEEETEKYEEIMNEIKTLEIDEELKKQFTENQKGEE